ncbi:MAG TPA: chaperonin GroEL [Planctomycetota bacterium]|nr:chaperonin GroEL [Planctomycetota bacterium]
MTTHTQLLFRDAARSKVLAGATALADAVRVTLGPRSRSVLVQQKWGDPLVCNDGVTIAKRVKLPDADEDLGVRMLREAAVRTGDEVGDGTTTSTILAHALYSEGLRNVVAGASAVELKRGLDRGLRAAVAALKSQSHALATRAEKAQVATIAAHNDPGIGELVADAMEKVGKDGVMTVEEAKGTETVLEVVEGLQFDQGFLSPYFITDPARMEAALDDALILLHEKRLSNLKDLLPLLEKVAQAGRPLLIVAEDVDSEALATLVVNKLRGIFRCAAVKAPGYGDRRRALLEDMAIVTGGRLVVEELGTKLERIEPGELGQARRVVVDKDTTTIIGGAGKSEAIAGRVAELRTLIEKAKSDYDKEKLQERLAKLSGGVALVRVGAASEAEMKARKDAFEDAISATKAAVAEGVVPGGGVALLRAIDAVVAQESGCSGDELTGLRALRRALEEPARQIAANSGADPGVVVDRIRAGSGGFGFDAAKGEYVDLVAAGIIDPAKVVRLALENAVSVAGQLLLVEATLTEIEDEPPPHIPELES